MIAAHLTWVAERYVSMTADALAGVKTTTYPAGGAERDASLLLFNHATLEQALARLQHASAALADTWRHLEDHQWSTAMSEERIGPMSLPRLVALRLTELEIHPAAPGLARSAVLVVWFACARPISSAVRLRTRRNDGQEFRDELRTLVRALEPGLVPAGDEPELGPRDQRGLTACFGDRLVPGVAVTPDNQHGPLDPGQLGIGEHVAGRLGTLAAELLAQVGGDRPGQARAPGAQVGRADQVAR